MSHSFQPRVWALPCQQRQSNVSFPWCFCNAPGRWEAVQISREGGPCDCFPGNKDAFRHSLKEAYREASFMKRRWLVKPFTRWCSWNHNSPVPSWTEYLAERVTSRTSSWYMLLHPPAHHASCELQDVASVDRDLHRGMWQTSALPHRKSWWIVTDNSNFDRLMNLPQFLSVLHGEICWCKMLGACLRTTSKCWGRQTLQKHRYCQLSHWWSYIILHASFVLRNAGEPEQNDELGHHTDTSRQVGERGGIYTVNTYI